MHESRALTEDKERLATSESRADPEVASYTSLTSLCDLTPAFFLIVSFFRARTCCKRFIEKGHKSSITWDLLVK